jgi:hypothetical protein
MRRSAQVNQARCATQGAIVARGDHTSMPTPSQSQLFALDGYRVI